MTVLLQSSWPVSTVSVCTGAGPRPLTERARREFAGELPAASILESPHSGTLLGPLCGGVKQPGQRSRHLGGVRWPTARCPSRRSAKLVPVALVAVQLPREARRRHTLRKLKVDSCKSGDSRASCLCSRQRLNRSEARPAQVGWLMRPDNMPKGLDWQPKCDLPTGDGSTLSSTSLSSAQRLIILRLGDSGLWLRTARSPACPSPTDTSRDGVRGLRLQYV